MLRKNPKRNLVTEEFWNVIEEESERLLKKIIVNILRQQHIKLSSKKRK